jgi:glycosyltransferase involved in cell wall biosynthesis
MKLVWFDDLPEGGAKRVVYEQIKGLTHNHEITYITNSLPSVFDVSSFVKEKIVFDLEIPIKKGFLRPFFELSFRYELSRRYEQIARLINSGGYAAAIIHPSRYSQAPSLLSGLTIPCLYFAEEWLRLVYEPDLHPLPTSFIKRIFESWRRQWLKRVDLAATRAASLVVATSTYMQQAMKRVYGRDVSLLPLGVDPTQFRPGIPTDGGYFLFIGEPETINGYALIEEMSPDDKHLYPIKVIRFSKGAFRYSDEQMADFYRGAIATLCLAVDEPFGLTTLESMACQTPVIAVNSGGYQDTVLDGVTGILIEPKTEKLVLAMKHLKGNAKLRERMGKAGRKRVLESYSWSQHTLELQRYIERMVKNP